MEYQDLLVRANKIKLLYDEFNSRNYKKWDLEQFAQGFVGDVGDLLKLVMAKKGYRHADEQDKIDKRIAHELSDCLWSIMVISQELNIDLEEEFIKNMEELEKQIGK